MPHEKYIATDSKLKLFRSCRRRFYWRYVKELEPIRTAIPLSFGSLAHDLMRLVYLRRENGIEAFANDWKEKRIAEAVSAIIENPYLDMVGGFIENVETESTTIVKDVLEVVRFYAERLAPKDFDEYDILFVEQNFTVPLTDSLGRRHPTWVLRGKWDLVVRQKGTKRTGFFDHKFTVRDPATVADEKDSDTQPVAYMYAGIVLATLAEQRRDGDQPIWPDNCDPPEFFTHNIIRRSVPKKPPLLKNRKKPVLSQSKQLVTTAELYLEAIREHGLDASDYSEFLKMLGQRPPSFCFRQSPSVDSVDLLAWSQETAMTLRDMREVERTKSKAIAYKNTEACRPIGRRCPYLPLCFGSDAAAEYAIRDSFKHVPANVELVEDEK